MQSQSKTLPKRAAGDIPRALLLSAFFILGSLCIDWLYSSFSEARIDGPQTHYEKVSDIPGLKLAFWAELGRDNRFVRKRIDAPNVFLKLKNFRLNFPWSRQVYWHLKAKKEGLVSLQFPPGKIISTALFFTDGDDFYRMSIARSAGAAKIADELHDGRWIFFPLTAEEINNGRKDIEIIKLFGPNITISAVAAFSKQEDGS